MDAIFVNSNERSAKPWVEEQLRTYGFEPNVRPITGDYAWGSPVYGRVGVEAKEVTDALNSLEEANDNFIPRLEDELRRLQESYGLPILLMHNYAKWEHMAMAGQLPGRWSIEAVDNLLVGRNLRGIVVARARGTRGAHGVVARLRTLYDYTQKPLLDRLMLPRHFAYIGPMTERAQVLYALLSRLRGFKNKRQVAEKLADMGSLREVFLWDTGQFQAAGLTKLMAQRLERLLKEAV